MAAENVDSGRLVGATCISSYLSERQLSRPKAESNGAGGKRSGGFEKSEGNNRSAAS